MFYSTEIENYKELNAFDEKLRRYRQEKRDMALDFADKYLVTSVNENNEFHDKLKETTIEIAKIDFILNLFYCLAIDYAKEDANKKVVFYKYSGWFKNPKQKALQDLINFFYDNKNNNENLSKKIDDFISNLHNNKIKSITDLKINFNTKNNISIALLLSATILFFLLGVFSVLGTISIELMAAITVIDGLLLATSLCAGKTYSHASNYLNKTTNTKNIKPEITFYLDNCLFAKAQKDACEKIKNSVLEDVNTYISNIPKPI